MHDQGRINQYANYAMAWSPRLRDLAITQILFYIHMAININKYWALHWKCVPRTPSPLQVLIPFLLVSGVHSISLQSRVFAVLHICKRAILHNLAKLIPRMWLDWVQSAESCWIECSRLLHSCGQSYGNAAVQSTTALMRSVVRQRSSAADCCTHAVGRTASHQCSRLNLVGLSAVGWILLDWVQSTESCWIQCSRLNLVGHAVSFFGFV